MGWDGYLRPDQFLDHLTVGGFLFSKISESPIVHVPKLFPLLHWSQNIFCFLLAQLLPMVIDFFGFNGNFNGKMTKIKKWPKITFPGSKMVPKVSKWGF